MHSFCIWIFFRMNWMRNMGMLVGWSWSIIHILLFDRNFQLFNHVGEEHCDLRISTASTSRVSPPMMYLWNFQQAEIQLEFHSLDEDGNAWTLLHEGIFNS